MRVITLSKVEQTLLLYILSMFETDHKEHPSRKNGEYDLLWTACTDDVEKREE